MPKSIDLKRKSSSLFVNAFHEFKKSKQEQFKRLDLNVHAKHSQAVNVYSPGSLEEASRGKTYAFFQELREQDTMDLFDLLEAFAKKKLNPVLAHKAIKVVLQDHVGLHFHISNPLQSFLFDTEEKTLCPITGRTQCDFDVVNEDEVILSITMPMQVIPHGEVGQLLCDVKITLGGVYIQKMAYENTVAEVKSDRGQLAQTVFESLDKNIQNKEIALFDANLEDSTHSPQGDFITLVRSLLHAIQSMFKTDIQNERQSASSLTNKS